jgi:hypothetical protein
MPKYTKFKKTKRAVMVNPGICDINNSFQILHILVRNGIYITNLCIINYLDPSAPVSFESHENPESFDFESCSYDKSLSSKAFS